MYKMIHLFLDSNIYLNFYNYSTNDIDELEKIITLVENNKAKIYITNQVIDETWRNRDEIISQTLDLFLKVPDIHPHIVQNHDEYEILNQLRLNYIKLKKKIHKDIDSMRSKFKLKSDLLILKIFDISEQFNYNDDIVSKAKLRYDLWNPPWKGKSYWDAVNWELLLNWIEDWSELSLVSGDWDFNSALDNWFLSREWKRKKKSNLNYYWSLSDFFRHNFPNIKLNTELQKQILIDDFNAIKNFDKAKNVIRRLWKIPPFEEKDFYEVKDSLLSNSQIYWLSKWWIDDIHNAFDRFYHLLNEDEKRIYISNYWDNNNPSLIFYPASP